MNCINFIFLWLNGVLIISKSYALFFMHSDIDQIDNFSPNLLKDFKETYLIRSRRQTGYNYEPPSIPFELPMLKSEVAIPSIPVITQSNSQAQISQSGYPSPQAPSGYPDSAPPQPSFRDIQPAPNGFRDSNPIQTNSLNSQPASNMNPLNQAEYYAYPTPIDNSSPKIINKPQYDAQRSDGSPEQGYELSKNSMSSVQISPSANENRGESPGGYSRQSPSTPNLSNSYGTPNQPSPGKSTQQSYNYDKPITSTGKPTISSTPGPPYLPPRNNDVKQKSPALYQVPVNTPRSTVSSTPGQPYLPPKINLSPVATYSEKPSISYVRPLSPQSTSPTSGISDLYGPPSGNRNIASIISSSSGSRIVTPKGNRGSTKVSYIPPSSNKLTPSTTYRSPTSSPAPPPGDLPSVVNSYLAPNPFTSVVNTSPQPTPTASYIPPSPSPFQPSAPPSLSTPASSYLPPF